MAKGKPVEASRCSGCQGEQAMLDFTMAFQPIVDVTTGATFAYEALVRGLNGESAERVLERVDDANRYLFDQTCRTRAIDLACRLGLVEREARLAINFLPNAVFSPLGCIQSTLRAAATHGLPLDRLIFEFVEHEEMSDPSHVQSIVDTYRRLGMATAIDDIGAGYAGLGLLTDLSPDLIKLDMKLVRGIDTSRPRQVIVASMAAAARELGITVLAEGVETENEFVVLKAAGINLFQGYHFARPAFEALPRIAAAAEAHVFETRCA